MKVYSIASMYHLDPVEFARFAVSQKKQYPSISKGITGVEIPDSLVETIVSLYLEKEERKDKADNPVIPETPEDIEKLKAMSNMLITSGFSFDGYKVVKYSGYISGDDCITIPRSNIWGTNKVSDNLCGALVKIRRQALKELKEAAYDLGCNAVIGVDFDYLTLDPQHAENFNGRVTVYEPYVICVTANGNAVVIEKED